MSLDSRGLQSATYLSYGFLPKDIAISLALTGTWNTFVKLAMPIIALLLLALSGGVGGTLWASATVGLVVLIGTILVFVIILRSEQGALAIGRGFGLLLTKLAPLTRRPPKGDWGGDHCRVQAQNNRTPDDMLGATHGSNDRQPRDPLHRSAVDVAPRGRVQC